MESNIYTLNIANPLGTLGEKTFKVKQPKCDKCNKEIQQEVTFLEVEVKMEWYKGEDLFCTQGALIVSEKLLNELQRQSVSGFAPVKVSINKASYYDGPEEVPKFYYLAILNRKIRNIPIAYDYSDLCDGCGAFNLQFNMDKMKNMFRTKVHDEIELEVFRESYKGEDIFQFIDHPEFGISEKFKTILAQFNCPEITIIPAKFI